MEQASTSKEPMVSTNYLHFSFAYSVVFFVRSAFNSKQKKNILIEVNFLREAMESVDAAALFETADFLITKNTHRDFDYKTKLNKNEFPLVV